MSDKILRGVMFDKSVRFTAISAKEMVEAARKTHNLSRVCTAALGRALIMTSMMGTDLKNDDEKVTTVIKGGGEAGNIVCTAYRSGRVKGYIENPSVELPPAPNGKLDVALVMPCEAKDQDWLEAVPLETAGLSFFVSASDPLAQQSGEVSISEALTRQFLLPQPRNVSSLVPCTTLYEAIRLQLLLCGVPTQNLAIARGSQAFSLAITAGNAVGVMPDSSEIIANHLLICRPVAEYRSGFEIMLAWPRFSTSPALAQVFRSAAERIAASADL